LELVKLRASQINGCGHCIDMHVKELRAMGEGEQRLHLLDAWEESPFYSDRERAALTWCEAVTRITEGRVPDEVYESAARSHGGRVEAQAPTNTAGVSTCFAGGFRPARRSDFSCRTAG
jgi:AhpD family alkylhydroperoxidase